MRHFRHEISINKKLFYVPAKYNTRNFLDLLSSSKHMSGEKKAKTLHTCTFRCAAIQISMLFLAMFHNFERVIFIETFVFAQCNHCIITNTLLTSIACFSSLGCYTVCRKLYNLGWIWDEHTTQ